MVEEKLAVKREFYAGVIIDDQAQAPVMIFSSVGGTGIEEIAREHPESVSRQTIDIRTGLLDYQARDLIRRTGIQGRLSSVWGICSSVFTLSPATTMPVRRRSTPSS